MPYKIGVLVFGAIIIVTGLSVMFFTGCITDIYHRNSWDQQTCTVIHYQTTMHKCVDNDKKPSYKYNCWDGSIQLKWYNLTAWVTEFTNYIIEDEVLTRLEIEFPLNSTLKCFVDHDQQIRFIEHNDGCEIGLIFLIAGCIGTFCSLALIALIKKRFSDNEYRTSLIPLE